MPSYLTERIATAKQGKKQAVIPFITAEYPTVEKFWKVIDELDASGADIIEIGVPFSDPVADGPIVEAASLKALSAGTTLTSILNGLKAHKGKYKAGIVLMGYYNPFLQFGLKAFAKEAKEAGVHGCIVPDLPYEESEDLREALSEQGIDLITLIAVNTSKERMDMFAKISSGYVYLVSNLGTTGGRVTIPQEAIDTLSLAKKSFSIPIALGFGLKEPSQLAGLSQLPDAVVIGSAFLEHIENNGDVATFMKPWA